MRTQKAEPIGEEVVKTTAMILGSQSAAALALKDADRRRAAGETVVFFRVSNSIVVRGTPAHEPVEVADCPDHPVEPVRLTVAEQVKLAQAEVATWPAGVLEATRLPNELSLK